MSQPWMKFYPSDWRADPALRTCSLGARGLWAEMMCLMHEAEPYGFLLINGVPVNDKQLASLAGSNHRETVRFLAELESSGVFSRDDQRVIYSRRMKRDQEKAEKDKANGGKGGNPKITTPVNPPVKPKASDGIKPRSQIPEAKKEDDEDSARPPLISAEANELADKVATIVGHDLSFVPPAWHGAAWRTQTWLNEGWKPGIILDSVREQMGRRHGDKPDRIQYFEKGIAAAHARAARPLPTVKIIEGETVNVHEKSGSVIAAADRLVARLADFDRPPPDSGGASLRSGEGANVVRLLPER